MSDERAYTGDDKVMSRMDERRMKQATADRLKLRDKNKFENEIENKPG